MKNSRALEESPSGVAIEDETFSDASELLDGEATQLGDLPAGLRPALVVGLGGTGHRITAHLKARLIDAYGAVPTERIRLLAFDTADEAIDVSVDGQPASLEVDRELFHIGHTPVPNILHNLDRHPAIAERLPCIQSIPPVALRAGSKQVRPLGLLALLWRFDEVERRIADAIWELAGKETLARRGGVPQGINVFICHSLVGGTGSGMFLDIAYLVRAIFAEMGSMGDFCYVTGVGVLPQAFRGIEGPNIVVNTVAALKELGYCMQRGGFDCQYPNGRWISTPESPFNLYYLVDGVDEHGYTWRGLNELCAMVAAGLYLQIGSQLGRKGENDFDNLDGILAQQTADGEGTFCGSFGIASLYFPAGDVAAWCAARLGGAMIEQGLLRPACEDVVEEAVLALLRAQALDAPALLRDLAQDDEGVPFAVELRLPPWLQRANDTHTVQELIRHVHDYRRLRINGDFHTWIKANSATLQGHLDEALARAVAAALVDPRHGVNGALALAGALDRRLETLGRELETQQAIAEGDRDRLQADLSDHEENLRRAASSGVLFRGRAIAAARRRYVEMAERALTGELASLLAEAGVALVARLRRGQADRLQALDGLRARLLSARRTLKEEESATLRVAQREEVGRMCLASTTYCEALYTRHAPAPQEAASELLRETLPEVWADLETEALAGRIRTAAAGFFQVVAGMTVEDALRECAAETSPQAHQERLFRLAAPSWNLDVTRLHDGGAQLRAVHVLGVPDEAATVFDAPAVVSTHNPAAVTAFLATIGAPYTALQQYTGYERQYEAARSSRPLHVLPQFQAEDEHARLAFALAAVFGMVFTRGFYYYYRPEDPLDAPLKLGNGLANSLHVFARTDTLPQQAMARVDRRIEEIGTTQALAILISYYTRDDGGDGDASSTMDELVADLRKRVRAYAAELRQAQRVAGTE
jgi:hypothetical protein